METRRCCRETRRLGVDQQGKPGGDRREPGGLGSVNKGDPEVTEGNPELGGWSTDMLYSWQ